MTVSFCTSRAAGRTTIKNKNSNSQRNKTYSWTLDQKMLHARRSTGIFTTQPRVSVYRRRIWSRLPLVRPTGQTQPVAASTTIFFNMSGFSGRVSLPTIPPAKTIIMYRNGDAFFTGRKFVINERHVLNFENVLSLVTKGIEAPYGAVRNVYTARDGHRVLDLEHLQNGERYVAAGRERFKKLEWVDRYLEMYNNSKEITILYIICHIFVK